MHESAVYISDEEIASIAHRLLECTLPKSQWTHAAHVVVTFWMLKERPEIDVPREMPTFIRAYNVATGVANTASSGYHETITQASIRAVRSFLGRDPSRPLVAICNAALTSFLGRPDWLLTYWTRQRLFSAEARVAWCEPDIVKLPF